MARVGRCSSEPALPEYCSTDLNWDAIGEEHDEYKPLLAQQRLGYAAVPRQKPVTSARNWRNVFTIAVALVDYFIVYSSISLIGTFFPTEVG